MTSMWLKNKYQNTSRDTKKIVENTIDIILQHYGRPAHHSHKTTAAYGDEDGYLSLCWIVCYRNTLWSILWVYILLLLYTFVLITLVEMRCRFHLPDQLLFYFMKLISISILHQLSHFRKNSVGLQLLNNHCCFFSTCQQFCCGCGFFGWCYAGHAITWDDLTHVLLYYVFYVSLSYHIQQY